AGLEVVGVDDNPEAVELARAVAAEEPGLRLTYEAQELATLELPAEAFDTVCAWQSLHHQELSPLLAHQIWRTLRPGGAAVLQDFCGAEGEHPLQERARSDAALLRVARWSRPAARLGWRDPPAGAPRATEASLRLARLAPLSAEDRLPRPI